MLMIPPPVSLVDFDLLVCAKKFKASFEKKSKQKKKKKSPSVNILFY